MRLKGRTALVFGAGSVGEGSTRADGYACNPVLVVASSRGVGRAILFPDGRRSPIHRRKEPHHV